MATGDDEGVRESGEATDSGQTDPTGVTIHDLMPKVMQSIGAIGKDRTNESQHFKFRGIDDVMTAVQPALVEHGVYYVPEVIASEHERYQTKNGTAMRSATLTVRYTFYGPSGDHVVAVGIGEAADAGDKATSKALAMALKYALLQTFCVPTGDPDPDSQNVDGASAPARSPRSSSGSRRARATESGSTSSAPAPVTIAPTVQGWLDAGIKHDQIMLAVKDAAKGNGDRVPRGLGGINTKELKAETLAALKLSIDALLASGAGAGSTGPEEGAESVSGCPDHTDDPQPDTCNACFDLAHGVPPDTELVKGAK